MAGKTLPGIGEDESGEHAVDPSEILRVGPKDAAKPLSGADKTPARPVDKTPAKPTERATDRMPVGIPMRTIIGAPPVTFDGPTATTSVDDDKVAEGLKRLRSLDEPLGPIPSSMPTLKEGIPVVTDPPAPTPTPVPPGMTGADMIRSRGTAHGHALSAPGSGQGLVPMAVDDRLKGTLLGHSLHLPDLPMPGAEVNRAPEVRAIAPIVARATPAGSQPAAEQQPGVFSHGDARFFESDPVNTELEPEHPRSTKVVRGVAIAAAVGAVLVVAAVAWTHSSKSDGAREAPAESKAQPAEPTPPAAPDNTAPPAAAPAPAAAIAPPPVPAPAPAPAAGEPTPPAPDVPVESPAAKLKRDVAAASATQSPSPPTPSSHRSSHSAESSSSHSSTSRSPAAPRPAAPAPGKRKVGVEEDPDGTLPLTE